jgi:hypothetical protein
MGQAKRKRKDLSHRALRKSTEDTEKRNTRAQSGSDCATDMQRGMELAGLKGGAYTGKMHRKYSLEFD